MSFHVNNEPKVLIIHCLSYIHVILYIGDDFHLSDAARASLVGIVFVGELIGTIMMMMSIAIDDDDGFGLFHCRRRHYPSLNISVIIFDSVDQYF